MTATDTGNAPADEALAGPVIASRTLISRAVIWAGLAFGTAVTVLAVMHGIRFPGLEVVLSVIVTWLLLIVVAVTVTELLRRHHRAAAGHAARHGKRGALFAARHTGRGARAAGGYLTAKAAARWAARQPQPGTGEAAGGSFTPVLLTARSKTGRVATVLAKDPDDLKRRLAAAARYPDIEVTTRPADPPERKTAMTDTKVVDDTTEPAKARSRRGRSSGGGAYSAPWGQVIAATADLEPEDDGHLLAWMAAEVGHVSAYAEGWTELYETCVNSLGLDPVAMAATHDVADAVAEAVSAMAAARAKFAAHYSEVREFAANGGVLPHDGRWITGDGDA